MKHRYPIRLMVALLGTAAVLLPTTTASATTYGGVGANPAYPQADNPRTQSIFIYQLNPGQATSDGIRIFNNTGTQQTIDLFAVDSAVSSGGNFTCAQNGDPKLDVGNWIALSAPNVSVAANSSTVVPFTVTVPNNKSVSVGEHDGCIAIEAASETSLPSKQSGVLLSFRTAIRVVVTIPGKIVKQLHLVSVAVAQDNSGGYTISPLVSNDGNVSLDTTITTSFSPIIGPAFAITKRGTNPVLPHTQSSWNYTSSRPFWGGWYRANVIVSYNSNDATELGVTKNSNIQTKTLSSALFFAMPTPGALAVELAMVLLLVLAIAYGVRRLTHAKAVRHHWKSYTLEDGDTLAALAKEFGVPWRKIVQVNKLKPPYELHKNQRIRLPDLER